MVFRSLEGVPEDEGRVEVCRLKRSSGGYSDQHVLVPVRYMVVYGKTSVNLINHTENAPTFQNVIRKDFLIGEETSELKKYLEGS
jgi:hypothetical protein